MSIVAGTPKNPKPGKPLKPRKPGDWVNGGQIPGQTYNAYDTYGQGKPDFGKGAGPGTPYHLVKKKVPYHSPKTPQWGQNKLPPWLQGRGTVAPQVRDPKIDVIRKRLGWTNP